MAMKKAVAGLVLSGFVSILVVGCGGSSSSSHEEQPKETVIAACRDFIGTDAEAITHIKMKAVLGKQLFHDKNLSLEMNQSCASCHSPGRGFIDDRVNDASREGIAPAGSLGDNLVSIGDRNAPTAAYAAFSPHFKCGTRSRVASQKTSGIADYEGFLGGQFWDGREPNLKGQAGGPPINPGEMNMPSKAAVVARLKTNYQEKFQELYSVDIFDNDDAVYAAMSESIAAFETSDKEEFYPFDSKYDRSLSGDYTFSPSSKASLGKARFFSSDLTCAACHQLHEIGDKGEIFTSFEYHNIGVPVNTYLRSFNEVTKLDEGLLNNPAVTAQAEKGKFKVPTLRNVAVTAPYMHNGIFNELETVIHFYQHAKEKALNIKNDTLIEAINNPETGLKWGDAEIADNVEHDLLGANDINLNDREVEAMVCFLMSLTDARYETLLDPNKVQNCGL